MNFRVPQFIEVEDKIIGPFSFKQFIYLLGGAGATFLFYRIFPLFIAVFFIIPVVGLALALAFYRINNRPFIDILQAGVVYLFGNKLYVWHKEEKTAGRPSASQQSVTPQALPKLSESKLKDLAWSLDIKEKIK